jgi:NAD(P)-dependent dehydrogenase (short-subunit alcohol dehydrogenase family)
MYSFKNRVVLITGAAVGIGRACAVKFAEGGADLILMDVDRERLDGLSEELRAVGTRVLTYACDISDADAVTDAVEAAFAELGRMDVLVNNAALWRDKTPFMETDPARWRRYIDVNILGTMFVTRAVLKYMIEAKYGRIINVASVAGVYGNKNMAHYSMTKGAVISLTKSLAKEVAEYGITVNATSPGTVSPSDKGIDHVQESGLSYCGRTGSGTENAELICYLASEAAGYVNGQNIQIDGCRRTI